MKGFSRGRTAVIFPPVGCAFGRTELEARASMLLENRPEQNREHRDEAGVYCSSWLIRSNICRTLTVTYRSI